jgi:hypothetical protein
MSQIMLDFPYPFFPYAKDIKKRFSKICRRILQGDHIIFDNFCSQIYPFCLEIYEIGRNLEFSHTNVDGEPTRETPNDFLIFSVGANISAYILPVYKNYLTKSTSLYQMVCHIINEEKLAGGRCSFISEIWPKTKRTEGIDIKSLLADQDTATSTVVALLRLRDGRFVKDVINSNLQSRLPKDVWSFWKKKIELYIERYGNQ